MTQAVVEFPKQARRSSRKRRSGTSAEIIIFPGVRFERLPEDAKPARRRRAKTSHQMRTLTAEHLLD